MKETEVDLRLKIYERFPKLISSIIYLGNQYNKDVNLSKNTFYFSRTAFFTGAYILTTSENNEDSYTPVHNKIPKPLHWRHFVVPFLFLLLSRAPFAKSLEGSSHRFSPRRKTLGWDTSVSSSTFPTKFCWTSEISVTEATAAPFSTSWNSPND